MSESSCNSNPLDRESRIYTVKQSRPDAHGIRITESLAADADGRWLTKQRLYYWLTSTCLFTVSCNTAAGFSLPAPRGTMPPTSGKGTVWYAI